LTDSEYASAEPVPIKRMVYRVSVQVPSVMKVGRPLIAPPAGELHIDVGAERLRARFSGPGWPIDDGSEVRLRGDVPGMYLFDANGGRPLPPGQLSAWFEGQLSGVRTRSALQIRDYLAAPNEGLGDLLCALLAEWTGNTREEVAYRCVGIVPPGFSFGVWNAELTALVPMMVPRSTLRADAVEPPAPLPRRARRVLLEPGELGRIAPHREESAAADGGGVLSLENRLTTRLLVFVQGVPIGFVDALSHVRFEGLVAGSYRVTALRTSNAARQFDAAVSLPGELRVTRAASSEPRGSAE
jgi:hypothetical protein